MAVPSPTIDHPAVATAAEAIAEVRAGRPVVVLDARERQHEGDVTMAADLVTPEWVNFMATHACGLIALALDPERARALRLHPQRAAAADRYGRTFLVSIEAREGVATGISAADRAQTIRVAADPSRNAADLVRPGHVFPLEARPGGVLERSGHTEAAVDLARLAGRAPAGVICQVLDERGAPARVPELLAFCNAHDLRLVHVDELIAHRMGSETLVRAAGTVAGPPGVRALAFEEPAARRRHAAHISGDVAGGEAVPVAVRATGDPRIARELEAIARTGRGVLVSIDRGGAGEALDEYAHLVAGQILRALGVASIRIIPGDRLDDRPPFGPPIVGSAEHLSA